MITVSLEKVRLRGPTYKVRKWLMLPHICSEERLVFGEGTGLTSREPLDTVFFASGDVLRGIK